MNKKYVTDIDHSLELMKNGWNKQTDYYWVKTYDFLGVPNGQKGRFTEYVLTTLKEYHVLERIGEEYFYAPTAEEILEELPQGTSATKRTCNIQGYRVQLGEQLLSEENLSNCLAEFWCFIEKNKSFYAKCDPETKKKADNFIKVIKSGKMKRTLP